VLARDIGKLLRDRGLTVAVAESCTGGRLGDKLTDISGSSDYFSGGVISYSNSAKVDLLDVHESSLILRGAVSDDVARQMAAGARNALHSKIGIGITGIAGPTGGSPKKPVGLVYICVSSDRGTYCTRNLFKGSRTQVKKQAVEKSLRMLAQFIKKKY
jgi:PncC family amidohydrolase